MRLASQLRLAGYLWMGLLSALGLVKTMRITWTRAAASVAIPAAVLVLAEGFLKHLVR